MNIHSFKTYDRTQILRGLLVLIVVSLPFILVGFIAALGNYNLLGLVILLPIVVLSVTKPNIATGLFYISVFIPFSYINRYFAPVPIIFLWLPHLTLLLAIFSIMLTRIKHFHGVMPLSLPFLFSGIAWIFIAFLSFILTEGESNPLGAILSLRGPFLIFGSIILHRMQFSADAAQESLIRKMVWLGLAILPVTIFQRLYFVGYLNLSTGDMVTGPFVTYISLVFFQLFCVMAVLSWWLNGHRLLPLHPALTLILLFASLIVSNSKAAPIYFFIVVMLLLWQYRRQLSGRLFGGLVFLGILGIAGTIAADNIYQASYKVSYSYVERWYNPEGILTYLLDSSSETGELQRGAALVFSYNLIKHESPRLFFGFGPGALSNSRVSGGMGYIYSKYPFLGINSSSIGILLGELGLAGIGLLMAISVSLYFLRSSNEKFRLISLRKGTAFLFASMLIYGTMHLLPEVALVIGLMSIQPYEIKR